MYGQIFRDIGKQEINKAASKTITATIYDLGGQSNRYSIQLRNGAIAYTIPGPEGLQKNNQVAVLSFPGTERYQIIGTTYTFTRQIQEVYV